MRKWLTLNGDKVIMILVVLLGLFSVVSVFSASTFIANKEGVSKTSIFFSQSAYVLGGFVAMLFGYFCPTRFYRKLAFLMFVASVFGLLLLFTPLKAEYNHTVRGIKMFGFTVQVFEIAKFGTVFYLAKALDLWGESLTSFKEFALKFLLPVMAVCLIIMMNNVSTSILIGSCFIGLLFFFKIEGKYILETFGIIIAVVAFLTGIYNSVYSTPAKKMELMEKKEKNLMEQTFRRFGTVQTRVVTYSRNLGKSKEEKAAEIAQMSKAEKKEYLDHIRQSENAKIAIAQGGLPGKGPGNSTQRFSLSEAFSDFIYAFIVEEYGLIIGGILIVLIYLILMFRCIRIGVNCPDTFSSALITGLSLTLVMQAFLHISVNVGIAPVTGQTLPLVSHGGTAYIVTGGVMGVILSISKEIYRNNYVEEIEEEEYREESDNE